MATTSDKRPTPDGFLSVLKPLGWTSHDVVQAVRKLAGTRRVGHAGTLDPAATGVLVVAIGRATRLIERLSGQDKVYCADFVLGAATDTDDAAGTVLSARDPSHLTLDQAVHALSGLTGEQAQVPPRYSAVKLEGRKAYEIARKGGDAKLQPRRVVIYGMALLEWQPPVLSVLVRCSKGTYIRGLARDLGERLGVGAHLGALVRVRSGRYTCEDALPLEQLRDAAEFGFLHELVWPPDAAAADLPAMVLTAGHVRHMLGGRRWPAAGGSAGVQARVFSGEGAFLGMAEREGDSWQPRLVLAEER